MTRERYTNQWETTLASDLTAGATNVVVASSTLAPAPNFRVVIETEILLVTTVAHPNWTVSRGQEGTTAASHLSGVRVVHILTAAGLLASSGPLTTQGDMTYALTDGEPTRRAIGSAGDFMRVSGGVPTWSAVPGGLAIVIDGGGAVVAVNTKFDFPLDWAGTWTQWTMLADVSGSMVLNVWKDTYGNYPPTVADKITASAPPTITASTKGQSSALTGWTTAFAAGDTLRFNVDSCTSITKVTLALKYTRS